MRSSPGRSALLGVGGWVLATSVSVACGGGDRTPVAATSDVTAATKPSGTSAQSAATATGQGTTLSLVAKDALFDNSELKAKPGDVTIVMDNQDPGIPHNLHVFKGNNAKGQDIGKTDIAAGPTKQTLKLNLAAGVYFLWCDVHSSTASATLRVE